MTRFRLTTALMGVLGIVLAILIAVSAFNSIHTPPRLLHAPKSAQENTNALMQYLCQGDFTGVRTLLSGSPDLGLDREPENAVGAMLWNAWLQSTSYEFLGDCYATPSGLARDVRFSALDITRITQELDEPARILLEQRVAECTDPSMIYDENQNYHQSFVDEILCEAAAQILADNPPYIQTTLTLQLVYEQGQWRIVADSALLSIISGGISG